MTTPEFYDREYNARAAIPATAEIFARWQQESKRCSAEMAGLKDLKYGPAAGQTLDLFWCLQPDRPLFVFIHGGYWRALDKSDFTWIAEPFLKAGINVAVINYDLVPDIELEGLIRQVLESLVWLHDHAEALDFDPRQIHIGGHSAGGHLVAMMLAARWPDLREDLPADLIKGGVALSGLYDLDPISKAPFLNVDLKLDATRARAMSPAFMPPAHRAPLVLTVGGDESSEFHRQTRLLAEAWQGKVSITEVAAPGRNHLTLCDALADPGHALFRAAVAMIDPR